MSFTPPPLSPLSPLLTLPREQLEKLGSWEIRLQETGEKLLEEYRSTRQWKQVGQLAQTLSCNSERIVCLRQCIREFDSSSPPTPSKGGRNETMDEGGLLPAVTVECVQLPSSKMDSSVNKHLPCWSVKLASNMESGILRSSHDVLCLSSYLSNAYALPILELTEEENLSPLELQTWLTHALEGDESRSDPLLQSFLSDKVDNFCGIISSNSLSGE